MLRRRLAAALLTATLATTLAACDGEGDADTQQAPTGQEDPTLSNETDGANPASGATDNGSGTGSGRGTP